MPLSSSTPAFCGKVRSRRIAGAGLALAVSALVGGCPMFSDRPGCWDHRDCAQGFSCDRSSGLCRKAAADEPMPCERPEDCDMALNCSEAGVCTRGDCTFTGCVEGYRCSPSSGSWLCEGGGQGGQGGGGGEGGRP